MDTHTDGQTRVEFIIVLGVLIYNEQRIYSPFRYNNVHTRVRLRSELIAAAKTN